MLAHIDERHLDALQQQCCGEGEHARALPLAEALGFLATLSAGACAVAQLIQRYGFVLHGSWAAGPQQDWGHIERCVHRTATHRNRVADSAKTPATCRRPETA